MKIDVNKLSTNNAVNAAFADLLGVSKKDIQQLNISQLKPYPNQPFKPYSVEKLEELAEDIRINGILSPVIVRPWNGEYQILAGHNRVNSAKLIGLEVVPCIVKDVDDNTAQLIMVNTNLNQRQELLPSEKAFAYKMQIESIKQGATNGRTTSILSQSENENKRQIQRYIRLTFLISEFIQLVDGGTLPFRAGVEISFLKEDEQDLVYNFVQNENKKISLDKAKIIRQLSDDGNLNDETLLEAFCTKKKPPTKISIPIKKLNKYFSSNNTEEEILNEIFKALEVYRNTNN